MPVDAALAKIRSMSLVRAEHGQIIAVKSTEGVAGCPCLFDKILPNGALPARKDMYSLLQG